MCTSKLSRNERVCNYVSNQIGYRTHDVEANQTSQGKDGQTCSFNSSEQPYTRSNKYIEASSNGSLSNSDQVSIEN